MVLIRELLVVIVNNSVISKNKGWLLAFNRREFNSITALRKSERRTTLLLIFQNMTDYQSF